MSLGKGQKGSLGMTGNSDFDANHQELYQHLKKIRDVWNDKKPLREAG